MSFSSSQRPQPFQNSALQLDTSTIAPSSGLNPTPLMSGSASSIVFVDTRVADYQQLVAGVRSGTEVQILDPTQDAIAQITNTLLGRSGLESVQIISHGRSGGLLLGADWLDVSQLHRSSGQIHSWASALSEDADILLYGCDVAASSDGHAFVQTLSQLSGADVAASNDMTGNAALGGDWELEMKTGEITADLAVQSSILQDYSYVLPSSTVVISQIYGTNGNQSGYKQDFVELYNRGNSAISLAGWSVQYASGTGTSWIVSDLSGTISAGSYFLIKMGNDGSSGADIPSVDKTGNSGSSLSGTAGKIALVNTTTALTGTNPTGTQIVDFVGYGSAANGFEGGAAAAPDYKMTVNNITISNASLNAQTSILRRVDTPDTDNNKNDFILGFANPRNAATKTAPSFTSASNGALSYLENSQLVEIDSGFTLSDTTSATFYGGQLRVEFTGGNSSDDILMIRNTQTDANILTAGGLGVGVDVPGLNKITYNYGAGNVQEIATFTGGIAGKPLVITFSSFAKTEAVQALLKNITYANLSDNPIAGNRAIQLILKDDTGLATTVNKTVSVTAVNDAPVITAPGASVILFDGMASATPNSQGFIYQTLPDRPIAAAQTGSTLETRKPNIPGAPEGNDYAGYIARPDLMPILDRTLGYSVKFNVKVDAEDHSLSGADKNGDQVADRAGFSMTVLGNDLRGIELGFWRDKIWAQNDGAAEPDQVPGGTLFTHGEEALYDTVTTATTYELRVLGNNYQLFNVNNAAAPKLILAGNLRDYSQFKAPSFLPSNPYKTPNFLFLGDNTPSATATFTLGAVSVTTGPTPTLSIPINTDLALRQLRINDVDSMTSVGTVSLKALNGGTFRTNASILGVEVSGSGGSTINLSGTFQAINEFLAQGSLIYRSAANVTGNETIILTTTDKDSAVDSHGFEIILIKPAVTASQTNLITRNAVLGETKLQQISGTTLTDGTALPNKPGAWAVVGTGDVDGDGDADIFWRNDATGENHVWLMNGSAFGSEWALHTHDLTNPSEQNWNVVGVGDFDGNGKTDMLWRNTNTGANVIWFMNGVQIASSVSLNSQPDMNWTVMGVHDFNRDGKADVLWRNTSSGANVIWQMNGAQIESGAALPPQPDLNWQIVGVHDFNGDGKADVLWRNLTLQQTALWQMDGTQLDRSLLLNFNKGASWVVSRIYDVDSDGKADIVWRNVNTNMVNVWKMNSTTIDREEVISPTLSTGWSIVG